jgi:hypothetical protein
MGEFGPAARQHQAWKRRAQTRLQAVWGTLRHVGAAERQKEGRLELPLPEEQRQQSGAVACRPDGAARLGGACPLRLWQEQEVSVCAPLERPGGQVGP